MVDPGDAALVDDLLERPGRGRDQQNAERHEGGHGEGKKTRRHQADGRDETQPEKNDQQAAEQVHAEAAIVIKDHRAVIHEE